MKTFRIFVTILFVMLSVKMFAEEHAQKNI